MFEAYIQSQDAPGLVSACLHMACQYQASDVHLEPVLQGFKIRYRVDGLLHPVGLIPQALGQAVLVKIKLLAKLDIGEIRKPQDGSFTEHRQGFHLDIRCNTLPGHLGEKLVMRLQPRDKKNLALSQLGMTQTQVQCLQNYLALPQGMLMVTGPTGAGKSITLYAAMEHLLKPHRNLMSVEDPVEIVIPGIHQVAPRPSIGVTFAQVLRAMLRQDPDVIMLGELRDTESADMAIKAAQTGHLLLTSMHTNSAFEAVSRCFGLNIDLLGLSYCLQMVVNQRLVRRLCQHCKTSISLAQLSQHNTAMWQQVTQYYEANLAEELGPINPAQARGCEACHGGYQSRIGVYEIWQVTPEQRPHIAQGKLPEVGNSQGLLQQAMMRVLSGDTSTAEVKRVLV